ncbi:hypothetical protein RCO27_10360 [Sphingosinicella sp. LHD-64]|uniref:hypothetical protein n=1 Tax=Sphingosinicella sp. LHD-64 TaxID=3072139 RepID=UPI00280FB79E|nr:hypothetical protein [Sphingosinicella sp. LHD-64]MDQ8756635.1 hypothetical protein [Sphingosinicella sp. LHD-64]
MTQVKAFAALVIVAFTVDMAAFDGAYRHAWARSVHHAVHQVSSLHWTGFIGG